MIYAQFDHMTFSFPTQVIARDITFQLKESCRIGLIGANGSGKTTLFKLLTGVFTPDSGSVIRARDLRIGHLPQIATFMSDDTLREEVRKPFEHLRKMEADLERLTQEMSVGAGTDLVNRYDTLLERFDREGGYRYRAWIDEILGGLGFRKSVWDRPVSSFSGGEQARILLAKLLLEEPNLLLLDEPTNHLDIEAIEWLESYLEKFNGGVIIISHDRYFLDRTVKQIMELVRTRTDLYTGNYTLFLEEKAKRLELNRKNVMLQQKQIKKLEDFAQKHMAGQKTKQAQSRLKTLEKIDRIETLTVDRRSMKIHMDPQKTTGKIVLEALDLAKSFGEKQLFEKVNLHVLRQDVVGMIGPNGCGKSTLLKILNGEIPADDGVFQWGHQVEIGYFDQHLTGLDLEKSVLDDVWDIRPTWQMKDIRDHLGRFLFSGDDVHKIIGSLSGGEKARVALAKLLLEKRNVLLLDEPTNHLDLAARDALEKALLDFSGTVILVTHDRYLLDRVVNKIWAMDTGTVDAFFGDYSYYREKRAEIKTETNAVDAETEKTDGRSSRKSLRKARAEIRKKTGKSSKYYERAIAELELELTTVTEDLKNPELATDWTALDTLMEHQKSLTKKLDLTVELWENAAEAEQTLENQ